MKDKDYPPHMRELLAKARKMDQEKLKKEIIKSKIIKKKGYKIEEFDPFNIG